MAKIVTNENLKYAITKERKIVGDLNSLTTTNKDTIVNAINEVNSKPAISDYSSLTNKPSINNVELNGDKSSIDLNLARADEVVKLTGDQTISGTKTFSSNTGIQLTGSGEVIKISTANSNDQHCIAWYNNSTTRYALIGPNSSSDNKFYLQVNSNGQLVISAGQINFSNKKLESVADPTSAQDAATKNYVDTNNNSINTRVSANETSIQDLNKKIETLTGEALQWVGKDSTHSTADYTADKSLITAFALSRGFSKPLPKGLLVIDSDSHTWFYTGTNDDWEDWGISSVSIASNTKLGVTKGSTETGKVSILSDGTMLVNGFEELVPLTNKEIDDMFNATP